MAQQRHGRHHPNVRLAVEGEDRQKEDGVGMKMEGVMLVMAEDRVEEVGEGGNQPCNGASPECSFPLLIARRRHQEHCGKVLL